MVLSVDKGEQKIDHVKLIKDLGFLIESAMTKATALSIIYVLCRNIELRTGVEENNWVLGAPYAVLPTSVRVYVCMCVCVYVCMCVCVYLCMCVCM